MATGATRMLLVRRAASFRHHRCSVASAHGRFRSQSAASHSLAVSGSTKSRSKRLHQAPLPATTMMTTNGATGIEITSQQSPPRALHPSFPLHSMQSGLSGQNVGRSFSSNSSSGELQPQPPPSSCHPDVEATDGPAVILELERDTKEGAVLKNDSVPRPAGPSLGTTAPIFEEDATLEEVANESAPAIAQSNAAEANYSMLSSTLAVSETPSSPSDVEPSMPMELFEEPSVDPYEQALHVESETTAVVNPISSQITAPLGNSNMDPKTLLLQEMMDSAESNLHRMLALADDLYEEDEEAEDHGRVHGAQDEESKGRKRHHRRRRAPLRERVERMAERRRDEQSARGIEERELRLERRRRQWEESAAATAKAGVNSIKPNGKGIEGLGRERATSYENSSFDEEQNFWKSDAGVAEENHASDTAATTLSDQLTQKVEEMPGDEPFAETSDSNSSLADLLGSGMGSSESTDFDDEFSEIMTAPTSNDDEEKSAATEVPSTAQKPSLMELLGDDFSFGPNVDHISESPKPVKRHKEEEVYEPPSSLMDLLNENFINIPLDERGTDGTNIDLDAEQRPAGSLMDLLSENFTPQTEEVTLSTNLEEDVVLNEEASKEYTRRGQSSDPFELLNDCDAGSNEDSLMSLLDDDEAQVRVADRSIFESDSLGTFGGEDSGPNIDPSSRSSTSSLLDLLDDEDDKSEHRDGLDINAESISNSVISGCETPRDDGDLLGLLSTDFGTTSEWESDDFTEEQGTSISETVDELLSLLICATEKEWDKITNSVKLSLVEEAEREAGYLGDNEIDTPPAKAIILAEDILGGSDEFRLNTDEVNLALLNLAFMPPTLQSMESMVKLFKRMEDNRRSGNKESSPNAATYALLMVAFGDRGNDHQAAKFVCERMMEAMDKSGLIVDGNAVAVGARCLRRVGDIANAEKLLSDSLGEAGSGVEVSPRVFHHALALYKEDNLQEEAMKLLDVFINETGIGGNERKLDEFVKSLIRWSQRNRRGNRIALALHHQKILEYLETHCNLGDPCIPEDTDRQYRPSYFVWRDLLRSLFRAARQESKGQFELVRRACRCLVNSSRDETHPDHFVLQAGLTAAEALGDAKLASDMILWAWENAEQFVETPSHLHGSHSRVNDGPEANIDFSEEHSPSAYSVETGENADLDAEPDSLFGTISKDTSKDDEIRQGDEQAECHHQEDFQSPAEEAPPSTLLSILEDSDPGTHESEWITAQEDEDALDSDWLHSEHEGGPPRYFIHIPTKAYYSAVKVCLASGEPELAHSVLKAGCIGPSDEVDMRLPDSTRSHLFNLVMSGYSQKGDFANAQSLLEEMQSSGPRPTEHTYAAYITSLAIAGKFDEATSIIDSMLSNENGDDILPGCSSFGACMLAALQAKAYKEVLDLNTKMINAGISPNSQIYFGVVLASTRLGDRASALKAAESALESKLPINHQGLNLLLKALLPDSFGDGSITNIRSNLRSMGKENKDLAAAANSLSRSLRMVETEERRPKTTKDVEKCEQMWQMCLRDLCTLVHQKDGF